MKKLTLKKQKEYLIESINGGPNFSEILKSHGYDYDDLLYEENPKLKDVEKKYYTLDDFKKKKNNIPVISFFSGAGGLDLGFEAAGYEHTALVEHIELFCDTLRHNRPEWNVMGPPDFSGDVSDTKSLSERIGKLIGSKGFDGVFVGGPPCQPFSIAANQRFNKNGDNFKRVGFAHEKNGNLLFDYINLIKKFKPRAFLIENVPGLLEVDGGEQLQRAYRDLESVGYTMNQPMPLIAAEYSVPQNRTRLFIIGNRAGKDFKMNKSSGTQLACGGVFDLSLDNLKNHVTREHSAESILRYMNLEYGARDQRGRVDRLNPILPSKTVIAGGNSGGGRSHLHPYIPRTLSVRESARIQTFPDEYEFLGPSARQFTQVGNAVPPVLAAQLADSIKKSFF